jgi:hypothetical protein
MREFLIKSIDHLKADGWETDKEYCLWLFDKFNILGYFAEKGKHTCFFTINNGEFSHLIYENR